jgi:hypothetical protein
MDKLAAVWQPLIVCGKSSGPLGAECTYSHLILLGRNVITDLLVLSTILATAVFLYIGFVLVTSGGDSGAKSKAKHAAGSLMKGYLCIIAAWLLVYTISKALLNPGFSILY